MDTRIQCRPDEETKRLAQQVSESHGDTMSDTCRDLTNSHDIWLTEQVNLAFDKLDTGRSTFFEHGQAKFRMAKHKAKIGDRG